MYPLNWETLGVTESVLNFKVVLLHIGKFYKINSKVSVLMDSQWIEPALIPMFPQFPEFICTGLEQP